MENRTRAQVIEMFHLLFLRALTANRQDWFVLKGGANLRYFFDSPRYSNDIDLDFVGREAWQVGQTVDGVLGGHALKTIARQALVDLAEITAPKQTDTTRRWKIGLVAPEYRDVIRTKIEFSGRDATSDDVTSGVVPDSIVVPYGLNSPMVRHYRESAAIEQKIAALALRGETKARDVFDLELLFRRRRAAGSARPNLSNEFSRQAASRAQEISFNSFTTEVAPFLDADIAALYGEAEWDLMQKSVATSLEKVTESVTEQTEPR